MVGGAIAARTPTTASEESCRRCGHGLMSLTDPIRSRGKKKRRSAAKCHRLAERGLMECRGIAGLLRLEARKFDDFCPLLGFLSDKLAKVGGQTGKRCAAQVGKPRLQLRIGERRFISLLSLSMISAGVPLGAPMPKNALAS
jgi:hypothetical protein